MTDNKSSTTGLPRKVTAVGTLGDVGASYAVYEKNWICSECNHENYARRQRCLRCRAPKVAAPDALVVDSQGDKHSWREALDPATNMIYYYNLETNETQWERPSVMGAAPHATGWFGRGKAGQENFNKYDEMNARFLKRPARKQLEQMPSANSQLEGAYEYNIWYDKHIGDHWSNDRGREPATTRCILELDAGKTKADLVQKANRYFCLHFARGMCARGSECAYYHRLPTMKDEIRIGMMRDCFGRERHATDRDDMSGVGNFTTNSRTLYVGGLKLVHGMTNDEFSKIIHKHFGEWGEVENVNIINRLSICFVRYRYRSSAEFAKEAMGNQALEGNEVLTVRWAMDDPNPVAKEANARADHDAIVATLAAQGVNMQPAEYDYPEDYHTTERPIKRLKMDSKEEKENHEKKLLQSDNYPDTDAQYADEQLLSYAEDTGSIKESKQD